MSISFLVGVSNDQIVFTIAKLLLFPKGFISTSKRLFYHISVYAEQHSYVKFNNWGFFEFSRSFSPENSSLEEGARNCVFLRDSRDFAINSNFFWSNCRDFVLNFKRCFYWSHKIGLLFDWGSLEEIQHPQNNLPIVSVYIDIYASNRTEYWKRKKYRRIDPFGIFVDCGRLSWNFLKKNIMDLFFV